jgi:vacuolar protein sorting-associated protein 13A/C
LIYWKGAGHAELSDLALKKGALDALDLPITVKKGVIGKLVITIPWKNLSSKPSIISIQDLYLLACPRPPEEVQYYFLFIFFF